MLVVIRTDRGRHEDTAIYCDAHGEAEAAQRGWPWQTGDHTVRLGGGWKVEVHWRRGQVPERCDQCRPLEI